MNALLHPTGETYGSDSRRHAGVRAVPAELHRRRATSCSTSTAATRWVMAGGLDSFDWLKDRIKRPKAVVDLSGRSRSSRAFAGANGGIEIGAMTTLTEVVSNPLVQREVRPAGGGGGAGRLAADPQSGHARRQRVAGRALLVLPRRLDVLPRRRQHLLRRHADGGETASTRFFDADRCVAVNPSDTAPALIALDAQVGHPQTQGRAGGRCRGLLRSARTSTSRA